MLIKRPADIRPSEITPKDVYFNRRRFLAGLPLAGTALLTGSALPASKLEVTAKSPFSTTEKITPFNDVSTYNNYYEFGTAKDEPARYAKTLKTTPWAVVVEGAVDKPQTFDVDTIMKMAPLEE